MHHNTSLRLNSFCKLSTKALLGSNHWLDFLQSTFWHQKSKSLGQAVKILTVIQCSSRCVRLSSETFSSLITHSLANYKTYFTLFVQQLGVLSHLMQSLFKESRGKLFGLSVVIQTPWSLHLWKKLMPFS